MNQKEMRKFVFFLGFSGTDTEWTAEFAKLCSEAKADAAYGIPAAYALKLLDDNSDTGCRCTDQELSEILSVNFDDVASEHTSSAKSADVLAASSPTKTLPPTSGDRPGGRRAEKRCDGP